MSSPDGKSEENYEPPVAEDVDTVAGPGATAPGVDGTTDTTSTVTR